MIALLIIYICATLILLFALCMFMLYDEVEPDELAGIFLIALIWPILVLAIITQLFLSIAFAVRKYARLVAIKRAKKIKNKEQEKLQIEAEKVLLNYIAANDDEIDPYSNYDPIQ